MPVSLDSVNGVTFPDGTVLSTSPVGFRNRIINGDKIVDQILAGGVATIVAGAARAPIVDMFYAYCTGANVTGQQITATDGTKRFRYTGAASVTAINHDTAISAANSRDMAGKTVTLSAKLSNSLLTSVTWTAYYANTIEAFGTVASPTRTQIATGTFTITSTESTYSASFAAPAAVTTGIEIVLSVGAQISGTWTIGDEQLEIGTISANAIVVDRVEESDQLRRCQRYYEKSYGRAVAVGSVTTAGMIQAVAINTTDFYGGAGSLWRVEKSATPAVTFYSTDTGASGVIRDRTVGVDATGNTANASTSGMACTNPSTTAAHLYSWHWTAAARLMA